MAAGVRCQTTGAGPECGRARCSIESLAHGGPWRAQGETHVPPVVNSLCESRPSLCVRTYTVFIELALSGCRRPVRSAGKSVLRTPRERTLAWLHAGRRRTIATRRLTRLPLVFKATRGRSGPSTETWRYDGEGGSCMSPCAQVRRGPSRFAGSETFLHKGKTCGSSATTATRARSMSLHCSRVESPGGHWWSASTAQPLRT